VIGTVLIRGRQGRIPSMFRYIQGLLVIKGRETKSFLSPVLAVSSVESCSTICREGPLGTYSLGAFNPKRGYRPYIHYTNNMCVEKTLKYRQICCSFF
jgi:hypothetical protein